jgi:hypothetical protein
MHKSPVFTDIDPATPIAATLARYPLRNMMIPLISPEGREGSARYELVNRHLSPLLCHFYVQLLCFVIFAEISFGKSNVLSYLRF